MFLLFIRVDGNTYSKTISHFIPEKAALQFSIYSDSVGSNRGRRAKEGVKKKIAANIKCSNRQARFPTPPPNNAAIIMNIVTQTSESIQLGKRGGRLKKNLD